MPAKVADQKGARLAIWQVAGRAGLGWIRALVEEGRAIDLGQVSILNFLYTARTRDLIPFVSVTPPHARDPWSSDPEDGFTSAWLGRTTLDEEQIAACEPDEWLLISVWDDE